MSSSEIAALPVQNLEIAEKLNRIEAFLDRNSAQALLICRHENIAWLTAGQVEARVALGSETDVCSLLITRNGGRYYLTPNNEAERLADEEFAGLGFEAVVYPWYGSMAESLRELLGDAAFCSDMATPGAKPVSLTSLRAPLLPAEIERLRTASRLTAEATVEVLIGLEPGVSEQEMSARTTASLLARGVTPAVLLMGTDERIFRYKHALPRAGVLQRYGMVNLCGRYQGLVISITRFVHFGAMPAELAAGFESATRIHAALLHATTDGATSRDIFAAAQRAYAAEDAEDEIERHHQGGPCGYASRDWVITPSGTERVTLPQAFAYNPSLRGAKAEDTVLLSSRGVEILTGTPELPLLEATINGVTYRSAGVLVRS